MKKHAKRAFGIFHDGLMVRMVEIFREGTTIHLKSIDHTELDKYWYKLNEDPAISTVNTKNKEEIAPIKSDMEIDDFDAEYVTNYQLQASDRMLAAFSLAHGVIALNVYEDNIVKDSFGAVSKKEMSQFIKSKVSSKLIKTGEWQSAIVTIDGQQQHWLHHGTNRLFELLVDHQKQNRLNFYYQLADANDIVLTDYFKVTYEDNLQGDTVLVYLGQEYRKAFVFRGQEWIDTLKLQISQDNPEQDIICSKISLALDSAQINEPNTIICCGDLVTSDLIDFMKTQFSGADIEILNFSNIQLSIDESERFDLSRLTQYTIPIALAYKALFADDSRFTSSNFLPNNILEAQKEFKIAWHGFIVLFLTFALTMISTMAIMKANQRYRTGKIAKRELDYTLAQKMVEATEIQRIRSDLENQEKNIEILRGLLEGKNPWTDVLNTGNRMFANQPLSWLVNFKMEGNTFVLNGATNRRNQIINFANAYPNSRIQKIVAGKIHNNTIWVFEIVADFPKVDWIGSIEQDIEQLRAMKQQYGVEPEPSREKAVVTSPQTGSSKVAPRIVPISPQKSTKSFKTDSKGRVILPPILQANCPIPPEEQTSSNTAEANDYRLYVQSINKGNIWEYRDLGVQFLNSHSDSPLASAVRWWLCYRLYLDKEYAMSSQNLESMLRTSDRYYPYAMLLQARIDYSVGNSRYKELYKQLQSDYSRHTIADQVDSDLSLITREGAK